eukprot:m51a1_g13595 hypothetical protein (92) ;mRNA; f:864-1139
MDRGSWRDNEFCDATMLMFNVVFWAMNNPDQAAFRPKDILSQLGRDHTTVDLDLWLEMPELVRETPERWSLETADDVFSLKRAKFCSPGAA